MKNTDNSERNWTALRQLLEIPSPAGLGPERRPDILAVNTLRAKVSETAAGSKTTQSELILGLLLLWHDHLDESHEISQSIQDSDGSLLHGMMHRREPDYWNSKYWFRNAGKHPAHEALTVAASDFFQKNPRDAIRSLVLKPAGWDPFGFVDACERSTGETRSVLQALQHLEFLAVFDHFAKLSLP